MAVFEIQHEGQPYHYLSSKYSGYTRRIKWPYELKWSGAKRVKFFKKLAVLDTSFLNEGAGKQIEDILDEVDIIVKMITNLRCEFIKAIDEVTNTKDCGRVVVFVGNLD